MWRIFLYFLLFILISYFLLVVFNIIFSSNVNANDTLFFVVIIQLSFVNAFLLHLIDISKKKKDK